MAWQTTFSHYLIEIHPKAKFGEIPSREIIGLLISDIYFCFNSYVCENGWTIGTCYNAKGTHSESTKIVQ